MPCEPSAITVRMAPGAPVSASISMPPTDRRETALLKPRTHVAVFYRQDGSDDDQWRLFFDGEIVGYAAASSAAAGISSDFFIQGIDNYWWSTYALHFQAAASIASSNAFDAKLVFGTDGNVPRFIDMEGRAAIPVESDIQRLVKSESHFPKLFADLLRYVPNLSAFFKDADARLRFSDRLAFLQDDEIGKLITAEQGAAIFNSAFGHAPQDGRLMDILQSMMGNLYYGFQSLAMPGLIGGELRQFLLIPHSPEAAPPRCNVIFPGKVSSWSMRRMYLEEPTRARFSLPFLTDGGANTFEPHYYAPRQMEEIARQVKAGSAVTIDGLLLKDPSLPEESREDVKGVIPRIETFHGYDSVASGITDETERNRYFSGLVERELLLAQHRTRELAVTGPFNPFVVPGFTGLLADRGATMIGNIGSVEHVVSTGGASTTVRMDTCRERGFNSIARAAWQSRRFVDPKELAATYSHFFGDGHGSILDAFSGSDIRQASTQEQAASRLVAAYEALAEREAFEEAYTRRKIASMSDYFSFVKATADGAGYKGGPFRDAWRKPALALAEALSSLARALP